MSAPSIAEIVLALDHKNSGDVEDGFTRVIRPHAVESMLPELISAFSQVKNAHGRNAILFALLRLARRHGSIVDLALKASGDAAYLVRMQACGILAYALDPVAIPALTQLLQHRDAKTREDAAAAILAIERKNHHLWIDRDQTGGYWVVNRGDDPDLLRR